MARMLGRMPRLATVAQVEEASKRPKPARIGGAVRAAKFIAKEELPLWRYNVKTLSSVAMAEPKRATVYFDEKIHRALRLKAAETDRSVSELVNEAVRESLSEDAADLEAFKERSRERRHKFQDVLKELKKRGAL